MTDRIVITAELSVDQAKALIKSLTESVANIERHPYRDHAYAYVRQEALSNNALRLRVGNDHI